MEMTVMEARILVYLKQVGNLYKNVGSIQRKLDVNYFYLCGVLRFMAERGWLKRIVSKGGTRQKVVYELKAMGKRLIPQARKLLLK